MTLDEPYHIISMSRDSYNTIVEEKFVCKNIVNEKVALEIFDMLRLKYRECFVLVSGDYKLKTFSEAVRSPNERAL